MNNKVIGACEPRPSPYWPASALALCVGVGAQTLTAPKYKFDPDWPKTLPNKWKMGGVTGLAVDKDDNVWVLRSSERPERYRTRCRDQPSLALTAAPGLRR